MICTVIEWSVWPFSLVSRIFSSFAYSGRTKYSAFVSKLSKLPGEYLCPQKTQKAAVLLHKMSLNWHTKKIYILRGKMPTKCLKKIILRK